MLNKIVYIKYNVNILDFMWSLKCVCYIYKIEYIWSVLKFEKNSVANRLKPVYCDFKILRSFDSFIWCYSLFVFWIIVADK